ncbi:SMR family transporter [Leucobacter sp. gxy201]|uniref:DMT family transporter n=1 Tax=Leucobacter sp. gxy201 TaxID=2957200 RepID=UPI003DA08EE4
MIGAYLALGGAIGVEVAATLALRHSDGFRKRRWIAPVIAGYVLSYALLFVSLSHGMPLGVAYGIWAACGVALTALLARKLFEEPLTLLMGIGIALMISGVVLVELG